RRRGRRGEGDRLPGAHWVGPGGGRPQPGGYKAVVVANAVFPFPHPHPFPALPDPKRRDNPDTGNRHDRPTLDFVLRHCITHHAWWIFSINANPSPRQWPVPVTSTRSIGSSLTASGPASPIGGNRVPCDEASAASATLSENWTSNP